MKTIACRVAKALFLGAVLTGAGGCGTQGLAYMVAAFAPPVKVKAVYEPPKGKKYLVFVDDRPAPVSWEPIKQELATRIGRGLQEKKLASGLIAFERIQDLSASRDFDKMSIAEAKLELEAEGFAISRVDDRLPRQHILIFSK